LLGFDRYDINKGVMLDKVNIEISNQCENIVLKDYIANNLAWFVVSKKLKDIISNFAIGKTQFIPILEKG